MDYDIFNDLVNGNIEKGKLEIDSEYCSGYVLPNIHTTHAPTSIANVFVENYGSVTSSIRSHLSTGATGAFDPDSFGEVDRPFLEAIRIMTTDAPRLPFDPAVKSNYVAALNAAMISLLNKFTRGKILVGGMDSQEADLVRLDKAAAKLHSSPEIIVVDERLSTGYKFVGSYPCLKKKMVYSSVEEMLENEDGKFDLMIFNHTFTSFFTRNKKEMKRLLFENRDAIICGTFMDPASIIMEKSAGLAPEETMVEYLGLHVKEDRTYHKIRVFDSVFYDPVYNTEDLLCMFKKCGWELDIYHSSKFVQLMGGIKSSIAKHLVNIQCLRVAYARPCKRPIPQPPLNYRKGEIVFRKITIVPAMSFKSFPVSKNKGVPLNGKDIAAMGDSWWWGSKIDGVHCQCWLEKTRLCVSSGLGSFIVALDNGPDGSHYIEGEIVFKEEFKNSYYPFETDSHVRQQVSHIVVFDGMCDYNHKEDPFMTRWRSVEGLIIRPDLDGILIPQHWRRATDIQLYGSDIGLFEEGIVIQPMFAPPGRFRNGFGSARYIKTEYTYEKNDYKEGVIKEVKFVGGSFVRNRPDRTLPSTLEDIVRIEAAITLHELVMFSMFLDVYYTEKTELLEKCGEARDFTPMLMLNTEEYMTHVIKDVMHGHTLTNRSMRLFAEMIELAVDKKRADEVAGLMNRIGVTSMLKLAKADRDTLRTASVVLSRSAGESPFMCNITNSVSGDGEGYDLYDVKHFDHTADFVEANLVETSETFYGWQTIVSRKPEDNFLVHKVISSELNTESCYMLHEVAISFNVAVVNLSRLMRNANVKKQFQMVRFINRPFVSPTIHIQGYYIPGLKGKTMADRLDEMRAQLVRGVTPVPVSVRFILDQDVYVKTSCALIALEAAIRSAQVRYLGILVSGY